MVPLLLELLGGILVIVALWGLFTGRIIAGSKGLQSNYYARDESPFLFYCFVVLYFLIGVFILYNGFVK